MARTPFHCLSVFMICAEPAGAIPWPPQMVGETGDPVHLGWVSGVLVTAPPIFFVSLALSVLDLSHEHAKHHPNKVDSSLGSIMDRGRR